MRSRKSISYRYVSYGNSLNVILDNGYVRDLKLKKSRIKFVRTNYSSLWYNSHYKQNKRYYVRVHVMFLNEAPRRLRIAGDITKLGASMERKIMTRPTIK